MPTAVGAYLRLAGLSPATRLELHPTTRASDAAGARGIRRQRVLGGWCMTCEEPCDLMDQRHCVEGEHLFAGYPAASPKLLGKRQTLMRQDDRLVVVGGVPDEGEVLPKEKVLRPKVLQACGLQSLRDRLVACPVALRPLAPSWLRSWIEMPTCALRRKHPDAVRARLPAAALDEGVCHDHLEQGDDASLHRSRLRAHFLATSLRWQGPHSAVAGALLACGCHPSCGCQHGRSELLATHREGGLCNGSHLGRNACPTVGLWCALSFAHDGGCVRDGRGSSTRLAADHTTSRLAVCHDECANPNPAHDFPIDGVPWCIAR